MIYSATFDLISLC